MVIINHDIRYKNMGYGNTYSAPDMGNIRYPSSANASIGRWAYVFTQDLEYATGLGLYRPVDMRFEDQCVPFGGSLPTYDDIEEWNRVYPLREHI